MSEGTRATGRLRPGDYDRLVESASSERERLVVRLAGEAGLRPGEIVALHPNHVQSRTREGTEHHFIHVAGDDDGRLTYAPPDLIDVVRAYAADIGCGDQEPIVDLSPRRVQMIVSDVADRAADELSDPALATVSTRELRRFHARSLLRAGVDPRAVIGATAWRRLDTLSDDSDPQDETSLVDALSGGTHRTTSVNGPGGDADRATVPPDGRFDELVGRVVRLGVSLSNASTREAIEREACAALAETYEYAWIASEMGNDRLQIRESAFRGAADQPAVSPGTPGTEALESGELTVAVGTDATLDAEGARVAVPIEHADTTYGILEVGAAVGPEAVSGRERRVLEDLGRRLGQAIAAVERRRLLLADTVVRLSFRCTDDRAILVQLSAALDCSFELTGLVPSEKGALLAFVWLEGASPDDVFARATGSEAVDSARLIRSGEDGALIEFVLTTDSPALTLVDCGGSLTELRAAQGRGRFTAEFVPDVDVREVVESVEAAFPASEMLTKREVERSVQTDTEFRQALEDTLTDKQRSALRAAHLSGYFDWPRGSTAEELAESLGVSSPTFHSHLRRAQRKLLSTFFEDGEP